VLDGDVGVLLHGILYLYLQYQVAAALEVQPQPDILLEVFLDRGGRGRETDNAVEADQNHRNNDYGPRFHIRVHGSLEPVNLD